MGGFVQTKAPKAYLLGRLYVVVNEYPTQTSCFCILSKNEPPSSGFGVKLGDFANFSKIAFSSRVRFWVCKH